MEIKPEIKFGFLAGFALIVWTVVQYFLGFHTNRFEFGNLATIGNVVLLLLPIWMALNEKRSDSGKSFNLRLGMRTGLLMLLISSALASTFMLIYDYKINPMWVDRMIEWQISVDKNYALSKLANEPDASAIILSNTEMHLCVYFFTLIFSGMLLTFLISIVHLFRKNATV
jgi:hypothetical protein